jgi:hypothetical protein
MASDNTLTMPNASVKKSCTAHSFYDSLPREIRDEIYDLISQDKEELSEGPFNMTFLFRIRTTLPKVRLLNHQAKFEYDARPLADNYLRVSECNPPDRDWSLQLPRAVPSMAFRTTALHFDLACCRDTPDRMTHHIYGDRCLETIRFVTTTGQALHRQYVSYIEHVTTHLPLLEKVSINVSCSNMRCAMALQSTDEPWSKIEKLSHVALLQNSYDHTLSSDSAKRAREYEYGPAHALKSPEFIEQREMMATWTPATGWEADAKVTEERSKEESVFMTGRPHLSF